MLPSEFFRIPRSFRSVPGDSSWREEGEGTSSPAPAPGSATLDTANLLGLRALPAVAASRAASWSGRSSPACTSVNKISHTDTRSMF